jgi:hypothetical protein
MAELSPRLRERVEREYAPEDRAAAEQALLAYEAPGDPGGAERVRHAMLNGAKGKLAELRILAEAARRDYRDVLYWTGAP